MNIGTHKELSKYFIITFVISWLIWLPGVFIPNFPIQGRALEVLGAFGPVLAALILVGRKEGKAGLRKVTASSFGKNSKWSFLLLASVMLLLVHALSRLIYSLFTENLPVSEILSSPISLIALFIVMFLIGGGLNEEIGWRGYALDRLQGKYTALIASLVLGLCSIIWQQFLSLNSLERKL